MKTLTLIRHATANNKKISQQDKDRSLNELGLFQAKNIALQLKKNRCLPDYILCSPTKRTIQTASIICETLQLNLSLKTDNIIYTGNLDDILNLICCLTTPQQLFVVGHNPNLSYLAHHLCNTAIKMDGLPNLLPPTGAVSLEFNMENWNELEKTPGKLLFFIKPHHDPH